MTTQEVADRLVDLCRKGSFEQAQKELYSDNVVVLEAEGAPDRITEGINAVHEKGEKFNEMVEAVHKNEISDPVVGGNYFSFAMNSVMVFKGNPTPVDMNEICVFLVTDGKVSRAEFFYTIMPEA